MSVLHLSEAELIRDPAAKLTHVRAGVEVIIEDDAAPLARVVPTELDHATADPHYDAWFVAQVDAALADTREPIASEKVEAYLAERRRHSDLKLLGMAG
jgi:antitoxin (DNA-binding transcriptional repressor) of toxin-antitoxin stability system